MTESNVFTFEHHRQIAILIDSVGSIEECKKLGFVSTNKEGIQGLTAPGLGYLLYILTGHAKTLPEAFTAGWQSATDLLEDES